ncbi:MAG: FliI/YscN family ATPase [Planctomycetota bacterium]
MTVLAPYEEMIRSALPQAVSGRVASLRGLTLLVDALPMPVGATVSVEARVGGRVLGEVVGFSREQAVVMLYGASSGIRAGDRVRGLSLDPVAPLSPFMLGRTVNGLGEPIDGLGPIADRSPRRLDAPPIGAMERGPVDRPIETGVRAIDLMTTLGRGQRLGILAGPGVGKSTLLGTLAQRSSADVNVIALIGERGREVREFLERSLGPSGLARSVVVVATGDEPPLLRIRAAWLACAIAEQYRDIGRDVLLMMDSITRFAHAQRQVGLSVGEPPATKGYTPSVFAQLPVLLERAGPSEKTGGSVTGLYTVLVEGDDMTEPVADAAKGILDGHLVLSRKLAQRGHYPAVDVLSSVSRVADEIVDEHHRTARNLVRRLLASYADIEELVQIGAYAKGSDPESDVAVAYQPRLMDLLRQDAGEASTMAEARDWMIRLAMESGEVLRRLREGVLDQPQSPAAGG